MTLQAFDNHVKAVYGLYQRANSENASDLDQKTLRRLQGAPVLHITFSRDADPGSSQWKEHLKNQNEFMPKIINACGDSDWSGVIQVDLSQTDGREPFRGVPKHFPVSLESLIQKLHQNSKKKVIVIIDGYGRHAIEIGFGLSFHIVEDVFNVETAIVRSSGAQAYSYLHNYESPWLTKMRPVPISKESSPQTVSATQEAQYDSLRFQKFAAALEATLERVQRGEKVCLQAANNFGKTTALIALGAVLEQNGREDIKVMRISSDGKLVDLRGASLYDIRDESARTIILDEAGLEKMPANRAVKEQLSELEAQGKRIIRVYPGNVSAPKGYQVTEVN